MNTKYKGMMALVLSAGVASCSVNMVHCSNLDHIQINPKEPLPILKDAPEISEGIFLSKYTDLLDRKLSNYFRSGEIPDKSEWKNPFCAKTMEILTKTPPNDMEIALSKLKKDWLHHFEKEAQSIVKNNPTILVTECDHVVLPMVDAYLRKVEGDPSGFNVIKPQYDECIALSIMTKKPVNNVETEVKNQ